MNKTLYRVTGLNFKKFLSELKKANLVILQLRRLEYNQFEIMANDEKAFLSLCKKFGYKVDEVKLSRKETFSRLLKRNFVFCLLAVFICVSLLFSSNFVFKVEIFGLENVEQSVVLDVLSKNGYNVGKLKSRYDLDNIEPLLVTNIDKISFATGVIKGSTLIINVHEKIDNSPYIYDYPPILAPFDCVIKEIIFTSGTVCVAQNETAKAGDIIVAPYIETKDYKRLPIPAKAQIKAYVELKESTKLDDSSLNVQNLIEEMKKKLYNNLSCKVESFSVTENAMQTSDFLTVTLSGIIEF